MNWSDEHYVKLYTRPTLTWRSWGWQARATFLMLMKEVDHSGFIETGTLPPHEALAMQLFAPAEMLAIGLAELVACGTVELVDRAVLIPKFAEAQDARKSDAQKKRDERTRNIAKRRERMSPGVTGSHPNGPSSPAQPSPAQPDPSPAQQKDDPPPQPQGVIRPAPLNPADKFESAESFFRWAQWKRHQVGHVQEKPPHPSKLAAWWSEVHMELNGDPARLEPAFFRFAEDKHWETRSPSMPFAGFMSVWRNFAPPRK